MEHDIVKMFKNVELIGMCDTQVQQGICKV